MLGVGKKFPQFNLKAVTAVLVLQIDKLGDFFTAWVTPGCPKIEQDDFSSIGGEAKLAAIDVG